MNGRRVRSDGRPVYGRAQPLTRPGRRGVRRPNLGLRQRRLVILVILVLLAGYGLLHLFAITAVTVKSASRQAAIQAEAQKLVDASWRQSNLLTLDDGALSSKLQQADPLLRNVTVRRQWPHGVSISATLKQPSLAWSTGGQKYLLDRDGTVIGGVPAGSTLPVITDGSNLPVQLGQRVATTQFVTFVDLIVPALSGMGMPVTGLDVKDTTLDLSVATNKGYRLVFDTGRPAGEEISDLKAVEATLVSQKRTPAQYIDLRIAGKAYYK